MFKAVVLFGLTLLVAQAGKAVALPETPQGRHLKAFIDAFNTGDEKKYLAMMETHIDPGLLKRRTVEERLRQFARMRGDFGELKVSKVLKASADEIQVAIPDKEGTAATFSFSFEPAAPFRIAGIGVEIDKGER